MKMLKHVLPLLAAALTSASAMAATEQFHLSYTFSYTSPWVSNIEVNFTGERNGDLIGNLNLVDFSYNGKLATQHLNVQQFDSGAGAAVVSISGTQNNFIFGGGGKEIGGRIFGSSPNGPWAPFYVGIEMYPAGAYNPPWPVGIEDYSLNSSWRVTAVPEPETYGMMLVGVGLLGAYARRRKNA